VHCGTIIATTETLDMHKVSKSILLLLGAAASFCVHCATGRPQVGGLSGQPQATEERLLSAGWWPTKSSPRREEYLGPAACVECHPSEAAVQKTTPMAQACVRAADSKILAAHQRLTFLADPTFMTSPALATPACSPSAKASGLSLPS